MSAHDLPGAPRRGPRHAAGIAALAVLVLAGSAALFVHSSCAPAGATKDPSQQPETLDPDPDPQSVDLKPQGSPLRHGRMT